MIKQNAFSVQEKKRKIEPTYSSTYDSFCRTRFSPSHIVKLSHLIVKAKYKQKQVNTYSCSCDKKLKSCFGVSKPNSQFFKIQPD